MAMPGKALKLKIKNKEGLKKIMDFTEVNTLEAVISGAVDFFNHTFVKVSKSDTISICEDDIKKCFAVKPGMKLDELPDSIEIPLKVRDERGLHRVMEFAGVSSLPEFINGVLRFLVSTIIKVKKTNGTVIDQQHLKHCFQAKPS